MAKMTNGKMFQVPRSTQEMPTLPHETVTAPVESIDNRAAYDPVMDGTVELQSAAPVNMAGVQIPFDITVLENVNMYRAVSVNGSLTLRQANALEAVRYRLMNDAARYQRYNARHEDGTVVEHTIDAVRFILDRLADSMQLPS